MKFFYSSKGMLKFFQKLDITRKLVNALSISLIERLFHFDLNTTFLIIVDIQPYVLRHSSAARLNT